MRLNRICVNALNESAPLPFGNLMSLNSAIFVRWANGGFTQEIDECDGGDNQTERPFDVKEGRYSYEADALGSVTVRDAATGKTKFIQGAAANKLQADLKVQPDQDMVLGGLMEALDDTPGDTGFMKEIAAQSGTYNFMWHANGLHGTGTAMFNADETPNVRVMDVRDAEGETVPLDPRMRQQIVQQAHDFIGKE